MEYRKVFESIYFQKLAISFKKAAANSVARTDEATDIQIKPWILNTNQGERIDLRFDL